MVRFRTKYLLLSILVGLLAFDGICHVIAAINGFLKKRITVILAKSSGNYELLPYKKNLSKGFHFRNSFEVSIV